MGRQLPVDLTDEEEVRFLAFLKESGDIQLLRSFARTERDLFVERFERREDGNWFYSIWNRSFPWQPVFGRTRDDLPEVERRGLYYVANKGVGPVLEYSRHNHRPRGVEGRIYWSKHFSAPDGLSYDAVAFELWYERVVRWLRKLKAQRDVV